MNRALFSSLRILQPLLFIGILLSSCHNSDPGTWFSFDFESGSIGRIQQLGFNEWAFELKDDNNNPELPSSWRSWWYFKINDAPLLSTLILRIRNSGWAYYYVPVYSYDQRTWYRFREDEVTQSDGCADWEQDCELIITTRFTQSDVHIARFYPYTHTDLSNYISSLSSNPYVERTTLGRSPVFGKDIDLIKIADPAHAGNEQMVVWLHARSHPAETGSSFLLEGLIGQALEDLAYGEETARKLVYYIVPMHNPDGVIVGNYRSTPDSVNLESTWFYNPDNPLYLTDEAPYENRVYTTGAGGRGFLNYAFPETWWWNNLVDSALAMTIETTYGKSGFDHWVTPEDQRNLGKALVMALYDYLESAPVTATDRKVKRSRIREMLEMPSEIESKL